MVDDCNSESETQSGVDVDVDFDEDDELVEQTRAHATTNAQNSKIEPDITYKREWKYYKEWVSAEISAGRMQNSPQFLSRARVDLYFHSMVVNRPLCPNSARRIVSSLQWYADNEEFIDGTSRFIVDSVAAQNALRLQNGKFLERLTEHHVDPHKNLPNDMLTPSNIERLLRCALESKNWRDLTFSWNLCEHTFLRADSSRKLEFGDLFIDKTHGPCENGPNASFLTFILRKKKHKERADSIRVVGAWRHKNFLRCATGMTAMNLLVRLHNHIELHFYRARGNARPRWQECRLIVGWEMGKHGEKSHSSAYEALYKKCNVSWAKVTHLRKLGMEHASTQGMTEEELGTLSKHITRKIARYETELYPPILKIMAGFKKEQDYFVPRTMLDLPAGLTDEALVSLFWPRIHHWRESQADTLLGDNPDPKCAAHNFLWEVLPFLARVIFQDGIFWIQEFPNHEASRLLLHVLPDWYPSWAEEARIKVDELLKNRETSMIERMNQASQASFHAVQTSVQETRVEVIEHVNFRIDRLENKSNERHDRLERKVDMLIGHVANSNKSDNQTITQLTHHKENPIARVSLSPNNADNNEVPRVMTTESPTSPELFLIPPVPKNFPESMVHLLQQHDTYDLGQYAHSDKRHWPKSIQMSFSRRLYLYQRIHDCASRMRNSQETFDEKLLRAARQLDELRGGLSLTKYMSELKQQDPTVKSRKKRTHSEIGN
jgi:hypothetical protein